MKLYASEEKCSWSQSATEVMMCHQKQVHQKQDHKKLKFIRRWET